MADLIKLMKDKDQLISISSLEWGILAGTDIEVRKTLVIEKGVCNTTFVSGSH